MAAERSARRRRLIQGSTLGAGVVLALVLFALVNYLASRHYQRFDVTASQLYSLSEKSLSVARGIDRDVDMVIFLNPSSELYGPVDELLSRYAAANPEHIEKRVVDPAKNLLEARRLVERFSIERENVVVVATDDDRRVIDEFDLADYDYSGAQFGQGPTLEEFKGEKLITSALLALVEATKPKIVFTTGHGEGTLEPGDPRSLSQARDLLGKDNFEIEEWSSLGKDEVPAGTDLLVVAGPTTNFLPPELELFSSYLDAGGRMLMLLDPVFAQGSASRLVDLGLAPWLARYGVEIRDDIVIDPTSELPFFGPETLFTDAYGSHPIVESLEQTRTRVLLPLARSVSASAEPPDGVEVSKLVSTSAEAWGETDLENLDKVERGDGDVEGPVSLGVAVTIEVAAGGDHGEEAEAPEELEPGAEGEESEAEGEPTADEVDLSADDEEEDAPEARLVVYGDYDFAADGQVMNGANSVLLLNTFNWLVKRDELIDIEGRKPPQTSLNLSRGEISNVYTLVLVLMPGLAVVAGIWVYTRRRR
jgi:ABC-type uncharacterized transport system involved in gliding motility auxiliary subunit